MKAHKAISVIQFKLEGQLISEHPEYNMGHRRLLHKIDFAKGTVELYGKSYKLCDSNFPTVNPDCPYELTEEEKEVVRKLRYAFVSCEKLKKHIGLLLSKGGLYKVTNGNILFHGCIPMTENGDFREINVFGKPLCGKALYDSLESCARKAFLSVNEAERKKGRDKACTLKDSSKTYSYSPVYCTAGCYQIEQVSLEKASIYAGLRAF